MSTRGCALLLIACCSWGCGQGSSSDRQDGGAARDAAVGADASAEDAGAPDAGAVDQAALCAVECDNGVPPTPDATCFGAALTDGFGRLDGTLLAVQRPSDAQCAWVNDDHLIVQVLWNGSAYRMVVNILSDGRNGTDTRLRFADVAAPLPTPAWEPGWHTDAPLDYVGTLDVHTEDFGPFAMDELVDEIASRLTVGDPISVYATSDGRPESAHLVHRNRRDQDGAIVVDPDGASPHFLLFHFDGQSF